MRRRPEERDDLLGLLEPASCRAVFEQKIRCNTLDLPIGAWNVSQVTTMESSECKPAPPLVPCPNLRITALSVFYWERGMSRTLRT